MTYNGWLFVMAGLGFVDGWLACWWMHLIAHHMKRETLDWLEEEEHELRP